MLRRLIIAGLVMSLASFLALAGENCPSPCKSEEMSSHGQGEKADHHKAPDFTLENYDGMEMSLSDFNDTVVVLEWFNYDCPFVKYHYEGRSTMVDLAKKYEDKGVTWMAVNTTHYAGHQDNKDFAEQHSVPYPILNDSGGKTGHAYKATRTPEIFIVNTDGKIVYHGAIDNAPLGKLNPGEEEKVNYVDKALSELLEEKEITIAKTKPYGCTVKYKD